MIIWKLRRSRSELVPNAMLVIVILEVVVIVTKWGPACVVSRYTRLLRKYPSVRALWIVQFHTKNCSSGLQLNFKLHLRGWSFMKQMSTMSLQGCGWTVSLSIESLSLLSMARLCKKYISVLINYYFKAQCFILPIYLTALSCCWRNNDAQYQRMLIVRWLFSAEWPCGYVRSMRNTRERWGGQERLAAMYIVRESIQVSRQRHESIKYGLREISHT